MDNKEVNNSTTPNPNTTSEVPKIEDNQKVEVGAPEIGSSTTELPVVEDPTAEFKESAAPTVANPTAEIKPEETTPVVEETQTSSPTGENKAEFENRMINPGNIGNIGSTDKTAEDPNAMVNENLKKVEINYTPPSKAKTTALVLFFIFLVAFIIFLPDITSMVNKLMEGNKESKNVKITDGRLICTDKTNTTNLDKDYKLVFNFSNNKLEKLDYTTTTKGDPTLDSDTLDKLAEQCNLLKDNTKKVKGVTVSCDYSEGKLIEKQGFSYNELDQEGLDSAYAEAGGTNPQYTAGQDMDVIEKNMNAAGYTCKREKK